MRYVERNPVRAGLVECAEKWRWSSAGARLGVAGSPLALDLKTWRQRFTDGEWRVFVASESMGEAEVCLRTNTYTGRPAGDDSFVAAAEAALKRRLTMSKGGRPKKVAPDLAGQGVLFAGTGA